MLITIANEKGGSGKSTFCANIATTLINRGAEVLLIDTDNQGSIQEFVEIREQNMEECKLKPLPYSKLNENIISSLKVFSEKFDNIIVDTAGVDCNDNRKIMLYSDIVLIPTKPSQFDIGTLQKMISRISELQVLNEKLKAFIVINQISPNPQLLERKVLQEAIEQILASSKSENIFLLDNIISERIAYKRCLSSGMGILEHKDDKTAIAEFENFLSEFISKTGFSLDEK